MEWAVGKNKKAFEPIKWTPYAGDTTIDNITIRKGKKIFDKSFKEDRVKAKARGNAYIIGNGPSRKDFDLNKLPATGQTYGCNALYRDFVPDFIFSVDSKMTKKMVDDKVYEKCVHYTPSLEVNRHKPHLHLIPHNPHWISGSQAMWTACVHGHKNIFLIGFDFQEYGKNELNNIYQDTPNYGPRHGDDVFVSWLEQWRNLQKMRPYCNFYIVHDNPTKPMQVCNPADEIGKFKIFSYKEFTDTILNRVA